MSGRHFIDPHPPRTDAAHVMRVRELAPGEVPPMHCPGYPVTWYPLPIEDAAIHADSLNTNDQDDIRAYGEIRS